MLGKRDAVANLAVNDLDRARGFYGDALGLETDRHRGRRLVVLRAETRYQHLPVPFCRHQ